MLTNWILYYLITTLTPVISISTVLNILISLFRYLFSSSCACVLSEKRIKIVLFIEYDILIFFTNYGTFLIRLIFIFNSSIKFTFNILFDSFYFINLNPFTISAFFIFILFIVFFELFFTNFNSTRNSISSLFLRNLLIFLTRQFFICSSFFVPK